MAKTDLSRQTAESTKPTGQRSIQLQQYLNRHLPYWGHPGWLEAERWRAFVRNQPVAVVCRETLISNVLSMDWSIAPRDPTNATDEMYEEAEHYTDVLNDADGEFDNHVSLVLQDMYDLPFGGACEVGYYDDDPVGRVAWIEHIDAATLYPTADWEYPVVQRVQEAVGRVVTYPRYAINRMIMSPRTEIIRKGWGMSPPEKIYLAIEMLYRGDRYYANMLLDTPEAGIIDLMDMTEDSAKDWLEGVRTLFQGIDGFKVPVLYGHDKPAKWIPLNRPPIDMLYDKTTLKYAQIVAAGYGLRLSDIGMSELGGEKTLAGVIRGERQTKRSGRAQASAKVFNYFNRIVPPFLKFTWEDKDAEDVTASGRALSTLGTALTGLVDGGLLSDIEGRAEISSSGLLVNEINPDEVPEKPEEEKGLIIGTEDETLPAAQGGRGEFSTVERAGEATEEPINPAKGKFDTMVFGGLNDIIKTASENPVLLRRLIKAATRELAPMVTRTFNNLSDEQIIDVWLPEMSSIDFGLPSDLDSVLTRRTSEDVQKILEKHLKDDPWWSIASVWEKADILSIFKTAYEAGMHEEAFEIIKALYEDGLVSNIDPGPRINFNLKNRAVLRELDRSAAKFVTRIDDGTRYFIKRIVTSGVRQAMTRPQIAQALRDGADANQLLRMDGFTEDAVTSILNGMIEMTERRANSIINTEINRAQNAGKLEQIVKSGFKQKMWRHLGKRGITAKGNAHPCPFCTANEDLGFVPVDHLFGTVFKSGGPEDDGKALHPPAHPEVDHCTIIFDEAELKSVVNRGEYKPWFGK